MRRRRPQVDTSSHEGRSHEELAIRLFFSEERGKKERVPFPSSPKHKGKKDTYRKLSHERRSREEKKLSFQAGHYKDSVVRTWPKPETALENSLAPRVTYACGFFVMSKKKIYAKQFKHLPCLWKISQVLLSLWSILWCLLFSFLVYRHFAFLLNSRRFARKSHRPLAFCSDLRRLARGNTTLQNTDNYQRWVFLDSTCAVTVVLRLFRFLAKERQDTSGEST